MLNWPALVNAALVNGAVLSITLVLIMFVSGKLALDMWVGDYPPDVRQKFGPMSARARRLRPYFAAAVFLAVLIIPILGLSAFRSANGAVAFLPALVFGMISVFVFNLFDLLILDWLLFCTIQPLSMVLPGTEGMAGYRDYRFHFIGFLKGLGFCLIGGLVIAALWLGVQTFLA
ncbi:MAG TPA: hypothetical protein VFH29_09730 [Anaerolineales bacterium]|nr:hypothetical protein [Anaerolineales bacterium]